ncbi:hypothetical protein K504DRAFT_376174 [Pleomassaria siparia CBS 279.74]|uniref:Transcription factor domain-containing protein n=1 Tax=Pleomassaria siparia CBS 279.74 TaxID=1314801 RepID=A0A6G1KE02_9PLEO|nr:hypothetical protein K504DRAFT_376174 [Pleomassaria siparia CBS 279.74]
MRRRAHKRDGPPQLQFLTATDPSQFKDENAKRSVRSQAMIQYRYNAEQQKQQKQQKQQRGKGKGKEIAATTHVQAAHLATQRITPIVAYDGPYSYYGGEATIRAQAHDMQQDQEQQQHLYDAQVAAWGATSDGVFGKQSSWPASTLSRYRRVRPTVPLNSTAVGVLDYEDNDEREAQKMRIVIARFAATNYIGDGVDPFTVMPQFSSPELDSMFLVRKCTSTMATLARNRAFVTQTTMIKWLPVLLGHPYMLLSATLTVSTWLDMHAGINGDSKRTVLIKKETMGWLNERLRHPVEQSEDLTLIAILHLVAGEMWNCNEKTLHIHQSGIARLISHRGGMNQLQNQVTGEFAATLVYHCDIICESTPVPLFHTWEPLAYAPTSKWSALPESPLFCPRTEFYTILGDPRCSEYVYDLLSDMRDATDLFIDHFRGLNTVLDVEAEEHIMRVGLTAQEYDVKMADIRARLAALPSALVPGLPTTNDWLYESCRITAIIYMGSMLLREPFSVSADASRNPILSDMAAVTPSSLARGHLVSQDLTTALYKAISMSDTTTIWGDLSGVLYWVASVGSAAARTPETMNMPHMPRNGSQARAIWIRRNMVMFATRSLLMLFFEHPIPILVAQKKLLKVQELTASDSSGRVLSRVSS